MHENRLPALIVRIDIILKNKVYYSVVYDAHVNATKKLKVCASYTVGGISHGYVEKNEQWNNGMIAYSENPYCRPELA